MLSAAKNIFAANFPQESCKTFGRHPGKDRSRYKIAAPAQPTGEGQRCSGARPRWLAANQNNRGPQMPAAKKNRHPVEGVTRHNGRTPLRHYCLNVPHQRATTASSTDLFPCPFKLNGTPAHNRCPSGEAHGYPGEYKPAHAPVNESPCFHLEARQVTIKAVFSFFLRYVRHMLLATCDTVRKFSAK